MSQTKPAVIIVHGSWHSPEHYALLAKNLESHGYKTNTPWLPSMHWARYGLHPGKISPLHEDIKVIQEAMTKELDTNQDADVVLISHSSGNVVASAAIEGFDKQTRTQAGKPNGVAALGIIAGIMVTPGLSQVDWAGGVVPPTVQVTTVPDPDDSSKTIELTGPNTEVGSMALFYADVDPGEAKKWADMCTPQLMAVNTVKVPFAAWTMPHLPVHFLVAEQDRALPAAFQRVMIQGGDAAREKAAQSGGAGQDAGKEGGTLLNDFQRESLASIDKVQQASESMLKERDGSAGGNLASEQNSDMTKIQITSIEASHSPFLSKVEETGLWVRRLSGEKV